MLELPELLIGLTAPCVQLYLHAPKEPEVENVPFEKTCVVGNKDIGGYPCLTKISLT